jgi:hypothetical protein
MMVKKGNKTMGTEASGANITKVSEFKMAAISAFGNEIYLKLTIIKILSI